MGWTISANDTRTDTIRRVKIVVVGAGGQGSVVAEALLRAREAGSEAVPIGFVDDLRRDPLLGLPILGPTAALGSIAHDAIVVAIGDNAERRRMFDALALRGETIVGARHPWCSISPDAEVAEGAMISAGTVVTPGARIGRGVLLNTKSSVDHDSVVGDFAHISAGATVGARVTLGDEVLIALGASVTSGCRIGARSIIGAGSVVVRDIPEDVIAFGIPARPQRSR